MADEVATTGGERMTLREKAIAILEVVGEPIEPNSYCDEVIRRICKIIDRRTKGTVKRDD
jgi:hypothetical protein